MLKLTNEEIERYAPYHEMPTFAYGFYEYVGGGDGAISIGHGRYSGDAQQAYDREAECAMRRQRDNVA
jgi:hypothetical protein